MFEVWSLLGEKECLIYQLKKAIEFRDRTIAELLETIKSLQEKENG